MKHKLLKIVFYLLLSTRATDNVSVEIAAYSLGLGLFTNKKPQADRVSNLARQGITFSARMYTMKQVEKKTGKSRHYLRA